MVWRDKHHMFNVEDCMRAMARVRRLLRVNIPGKPN